MVSKFNLSIKSTLNKSDFLDKKMNVYLSIRREDERLALEEEERYSFKNLKYLI